MENLTDSKVTYPFVLKAFQITKNGDIFEKEKTIYTAAQEMGFREAYPLTKFRIENHFLQERLPAGNYVNQLRANNHSSRTYIIWSAIIVGIMFCLIILFLL